MRQSIPIFFRFNQTKGLAILEYLLDQLGGQYNFMALLKIAYFADRFHLRSFARPISYDYYKAMRFGTVPQNLYASVSALNLPDNLWDNAFRDGYLVKLKLASTIGDELSESERKAMLWAIEKFDPIGRRNEFDIANLTHAYPEWVRFREIFGQFPKTAVGMYYEDFVKNADPKHEEFKKNKIRDPFPTLSEKTQREILEEMAELSESL